ncbi:hypothetical protein ACET3Z_018569 [Daucus carota]
MSHYTWHNVIESSRVTAKHAFATLSFITKLFIFLCVGRDALDIEKWRYTSDRSSFKDPSENSLSYETKKNVLVSFTILKVEEEDNWFRIFVLADDRSLATNVIFLDRVVKRMVGTTVANILNKIKKVDSTNVMVDVFKQIFGKEASTSFNVNGEVVGIELLKTSASDRSVAKKIKVEDVYA